MINACLRKKCFLSDLLEAAATCIVDDSSVFVFSLSVIPYLWLPLIHADCCCSY